MLNLSSDFLQAIVGGRVPWGRFSLPPGEGGRAMALRKTGVLATRRATCQIRVVSPAASATPICAGVPINNAPPG